MPPSAVFKAPAEIPPEWARFDERVTAEMLRELTGSWPETSKTFIYIWEKNNFEQFVFYEDRLRNNPDIPFGSFLYKGHILDARAHEQLTRHGKNGRFWKYVIEQWQLPPTPEGWIPPDMR